MKPTTEINLEPTPTQLDPSILQQVQPSTRTTKSMPTRLNNTHNT